MCGSLVNDLQTYLPYCPNNEDLLYAVPFSCQDYLHCFFGQLYPKSCFYGFRFDRTQLRCRFFLFVYCNNRATNPLNPLGRSILPGVITTDFDND